MKLADLAVCETGNRNSHPPVQPRTGQDAVSAVRLPEQLTDAIDTWAEAHGMARSEAIRQLIELGLKSACSMREPAHRTVDEDSRDIEDRAARQIDELLDPSLAPEERERRIRRLTEGPPEFSQSRIDLPKHDE